MQNIESEAVKSSTPAVNELLLKSEAASSGHWEEQGCAGGCFGKVLGGLGAGMQAVP